MIARIYAITPLVVLSFAWLASIQAVRRGILWLWKTPRRILG